MAKNLSNYYKTIFCYVVFSLLLCSCVLSAKPITAFVSILPQKFFVNEIAGKKVTVETLIKPGQSPETFSPSPGRIAMLSKAKLLFTIGLPFEQSLIKKIKSICPKLKIIHTESGIKKRKMSSTLHNGHNHNRDGDPHIWLDPILVKIQADNIAKAIIKEQPSLKYSINKNLKKFKHKLDTLAAKIKKQLLFAKGKTFLTFHPAFGYFTDRYGLNQQSIEINGKAPSPKQLTQIIRKCKKEKIKYIFAEKQFASNTVNAIAKAIHGKVILVDPLAENYLENLALFSKLISDSYRK